MMKKLTLTMLILTLCLALLTACGAGEGADAEETAGATETEETAAAEEEDPILGFWFAETASVGGEDRDPEEVFGGKFYLYFVDETECQMCIDQQRAPLTWNRTETGVTLTGDDVYEIVWPANGDRDAMIITVRGVEVVLERSLEE